MRWTSQWPSTVSGQSVGISAQTFCEEPIATSHVIAAAAAAAAQQAQQQRTANLSGQPMTTGGCGANMVDGSLMSIDHQLHHQIQKQLCIDQFELLSQLQVISQSIFNFIPQTIKYVTNFLPLFRISSNNMSCL